jgi:hypothetical protein
MIKRHPGRVSFLLFVAACLFFAACNQQVSSAPVAIDSEVSPQPARVGPVTITIKISDSAAQPVSGAHIQLEGDMSHPGMAPVISDTKEIDAGRYRGVLQLNMAGDWVVLAHVILADGRKFEPQINVSGVQAN